MRVVDGAHRPLQGDGVPAVVADDPLRQPRGAGRVEDVERVGGLDRDRVGRRRAVEGLLPGQVPTRREGRGRLGPLEHDAPRRAVVRELERALEQGHVLDHPAGLEAARGGADDDRPGVVDARGQLVRGEAAEDDGVDRAEAGAGQHRDHGLGDHRHVDHDPVALTHALAPQGAREAGRRVPQLAVRVAADGPGHRAVVDQGGLVAAAVAHVPVERLVAGVHPAAGVPAVDGRLGRVEDPVGRALPLDEPRPARPRTPPGPAATGGTCPRRPPWRTSRARAYRAATAGGNAVRRVKARGVGPSARSAASRSSASATVGVGAGRHPPQRRLGLPEPVEPLAAPPQHGDVGLAVRERPQRLDRLPDRHVHDQAVVAERADRGGVPVVGLEPPDEARARVGDGVDRREGRDERRPAAASRAARAAGRC